MHLDQSNDWGDRVCSCGESSVTPDSVIKEDVWVGTWRRYENLERVLIHTVVIWLSRRIKT